MGEKNVKKNEEDAVKLLTHILELSKYSYDLEEKREQSILKQSGQMLTSFSIVTAILYMVLPVILQYSNHEKFKSIFVWYGIITLSFFSSLVLASLAQYRFKYKALPMADEIYIHIYNNWESLVNIPSQLKHWNDILTDIQKSRKKINDKRVKLIKASMICFYISLFLIILGFIHIYIFS